MKGVSGTKTVDASTATIERESDGKKLELVVQVGKPKLTPVDVQATLVYTLGSVKNFDVVNCESIELNGAKYKIVSVKGDAKSAEVVLENGVSGKKRTIKALE